MERFSAAYGSPVTYEEATPALFQRYSALPAELLNEWKTHGFAVYKQGLLWFTNPDIFDETIRSLFGKKSILRCVARTAFGDLILFDKDTRWLFFSAYTVDQSNYEADYYTFFDFLMSGRDWMRDVMRLKLYKSALKKIGALQSEQVYAFEPHPALGGSGEVNTIVKRRIFDYLDMLSHLME